MLQILYLPEKVIAISADNTSMNFYGKKRKGKNNLYYKLQERRMPSSGMWCSVDLG
jgi:hypothetical protein